MFQNGFLGNKASFMLDFVVVALILIVPILLFSLYSVKVRRQYALHKKLQLLLGAVLLVAVGAFEFDLHFIQGGWEKVVAKHEPPLTPEQIGSVRRLLNIHLVFAASTPFLWVTTIVLRSAGFRILQPQARTAARTKCWAGCRRSTSY